MSFSRNSSTTSISSTTRPATSPTYPQSSTMPSYRRQSSVTSTTSSSSSTSQPISPASPRLSPRVQLVPHSRSVSYDITLSEAERELLNHTNFDNLDLSSQDFDFEDIFTYDKPQKKLARVIEVTAPTRERDWSNFSFSHYSAAVSARNKVNRQSKNGIGEMYLKNQSDARKH